MIRTYGWPMIIFAGFMVIGFALVVVSCSNHMMSRVTEHVTAHVDHFKHVDEWVEQVPVINDKGQVTGYTQNIHPEEFHVIWYYNGMSYDQSADSHYDHRNIGDPAQMVVREGGIVHDRYLWPD